MQGTVIAGDHDRDIPTRRFLEQREQRRPLKPLLRDGPQGDFVARDFEQDHRLASAMREHVHEVEHERVNALTGDRTRQVSFEIVGVGGGGDLVIAHGCLNLQLLQVRHQQLALVHVQRFVVLVAPPVGETRRDLAREQAAEQRVAGIRRRGRQNREVVRRLHVVQRRQQRLEHAPLIHPQAIDDHKDRLAITRQHRHHKLGDDVHRERRPVAFELTQPARVLGTHERGELAMHVGIQPTQ